MTDEPEPRWELLPSQPEAFFGLEGEFDLRDLKRQYNALIRRFKPERFSDQFQRIRSAYEMLHDALRYGEDHSVPPRREKPQFDWNSAPPPLRQPSALDRRKTRDGGSDRQDDSAPSGISRDDESVPIAEQRPLHQRVAEEPPEALYQELRSRQPKTPFEYYALAVLSDVVEDEPLSFARWLLKGLKEHSGEQGLFHLLREYFACEMPSESVVELLTSVSEIIRGDRFYYATERLWDRLLREAPFETFRRTLEACETNLLDHQFDHQLTFYLHLLKPALWKASDSWLNETFAHVETHCDRLPGWAEEELDFLNCLRTYREQRIEFLEAGGSMRAQIDRAIVNYCLGEGPGADRSFLECQQVLVTNGGQLLREFPIPTNGLEYVVILWERIADDVTQRVGEEPIFLDEASRQRQVRGLAHRLMLEGGRRGFQFFYYSFILCVLVGVVGVIGGVGYIGYHFVLDLFVRVELLDALWEFLSLLGALLASLAALIVVLLSHTFLIRRYYRICWRSHIMKFLQTSRLPVADVADELVGLEEEEVNGRQILEADEIGKLLRSDVGLSFWVTAQRLMV